MLENIKRFLIAIPLVALAILPPMYIGIPFLINSNFWLWLILLGGFLGCLFLYTKADLLLKILVVYLFLSCFRSKAPYMSFTSYFFLILVVYYYLLCLELKNFDFLKKIIQALFFLNLVLIVNQQFNGDKLLNFARDIPVCFGTIGNTMWAGSLMICLTPFLLLSSLLNIIPLLIICFLSKSSGMVLSMVVGILTYGFIRYKKKLAFWIVAVLLFISMLGFAFANRVFLKFDVSRGPVWKRTIELVNKHPFFGYGIGTYKLIFPALSGDVSGGYPGPWEYEGTKGNWIAWAQAHNCWLQILFETGYIGFILLLLFAGRIFYKLAKLPKTKIITMALLGFVMISTNMLVHYPTRQIQIVLLIIVFLAFCQKLTKEEV